MGITGRRRSRAPRTSVVVTLFGSALSVLGLLAIVAGLSLADRLAPLQASADALGLAGAFVAPLTMVFQGGVLSFVGGFVLVLAGGVGLLLSA